MIPVPVLCAHASLVSFVRARPPALRFSCCGLGIRDDSVRVLARVGLVVAVLPFEQEVGGSNPLLVSFFHRSLRFA